MRGMINLLGPLFVRVFKPGASEVKTARFISATDSTTRATIATPTLGKKIRIISAHLTVLTTSLTRYEMYFHTGANITTNAGNEIMDAIMIRVDDFNEGRVWPDGGGPVGAVDEVVSFRSADNITNNCIIIIAYREE